MSDLKEPQTISLIDEDRKRAKPFNRLRGAPKPIRRAFPTPYPGIGKQIPAIIEIQDLTPGSSPLIPA
jgi:hypothetical protein